MTSPDERDAPPGGSPHAGPLADPRPAPAADSPQDGSPQGGSPDGGAPHGGSPDGGSPDGGALQDGAPAEISTLAASVAALDELADLPVTEHVAHYDALHGELSEALAAIDGI